MTSKFSRFLHLERSRAERTAPMEPTQLQNGNRFEAVGGPQEAPQSTSIPETHLERFRGEAPLGLVDPVQPVEHVPRCGSCLAENGAFARECGQCGADLTTPQQREYNEQLRQSRQQQEAQQREAAAAFEQERKRLEAEREADAERYVQLLKKTLKQEQAGARWQAMAQHGSIGLYLLSLIPHPGVRWGVLTVAILMPLLMWRFGRANTRLMAVVLGVLLLVLLLPHRRRW